MIENAKPEAKPGPGKKLAFALTVVAGFLLIAEIVMQLLGLAVTQFKKPMLRPGAKVVVCIGDSHTYGVMVEKDQTYPARLEKLLNEGGGNYQVINLGAPGQNSSQILSALPGIIKDYHPLAMIVLVGVNNGWNVAGQESSFSQKVLGKFKLYKLSRYIYFRVFRKGKEFMVARRRDTGEPLFHFEISNPNPPEAELLKLQRRYSADLTGIVDGCRSRGVRVVLMSYAGDKYNNYEAANKISKWVAKKTSVPYVDNYAIFMSRLYQPDGALDKRLHETVFFSDGHLKPPGYEMMAQNIMAVLRGYSIID